MKYDYIAYIDEAGDPGINRVKPIDPDGASEWLILSAFVVRASHEREVPDWVRDIRSNLGLFQRPDLHFRKLSPTRKHAACAQLAKLPSRSFAIISNKKNMRGYRNERAEKMPSQQWFYNWCIRLLLERVTQFCAEVALKERGHPRKLKIEFSQRGGHSYSQTKAYHELLRMQTKSDRLFLQKRNIHPDILHPDLMKHYPHQKRAGLQLADIIASAFFQAVNTERPERWDPTFAKLLRPIMAKEDGQAKDFGVALQPTNLRTANLNQRQQQIFKFYGYIFR